MIHRRIGLALAASALVFAACSSGADERNAAVPIPAGPVAALPDDPDAAPSSPDTVNKDTASGATVTGDTQTADTGTSPSEASTSTGATTPDPAVDTSDATTTSSSSTTSTTTTSTTTTTVPELDVFEPACVAQVQSGDSLGLIVEGYDDETINISTVRAENGIEGDTIYPDQLLDICVDNGLDDVTGDERTERNAAIVADETAVLVIEQQKKLNELLTPYGMRALKADGISGPVTRRHLCAARLGLGLDAALTDMEPGSDEEKALMAAPEIVAPFTTALNEERWILVDRTCQVMFAGQRGESLDFVYPTSTGSDTFETRDQDRSPVFRYDPALENDGWHDSTDYPVPVDNPLNGNMYRPMYFDGGQAIHGANNVPTTPQSKGCVRLSPPNQDTLVAWLGLQDADGPQGGIPVTVNVQGEYPDEETPDAVTPGNATDDA